MYKIFNPATGEYTDANDIETRDKLLARFAWDFYMIHTHNMPYAVVTVDGVNEVWTSPSGENILNPKEIYEQVSLYVNETQ